MPAELWIRPAREPDLGRVLELLDGVKVWLADDRMTDQWQHQYRRDEAVERDIDAGTLFLVEDARANVLATITVDRFADTDFWTTETDPELQVHDACYIHRMAVVRDHAGRAIGSAMLDWAGQIATDESRSYLRLDAWRTNEDLHKYYLRHGFTCVDILELPHRGSGALFQRPAGYRHGEGPVLRPV